VILGGKIHPAKNHETLGNPLSAVPRFGATPHPLFSDLVIAGGKIHRASYHETVGNP